MSGVYQADKNMNVGRQAEEKDLRFIAAGDGRLCLLGFEFFPQTGKFHKFDEEGMRIAGEISTSLRWGAKCAAGGQVMFVTDSDVLSVRVELAAPADMLNMCPIGQNGVDCYLADGKTGKFVYYASARFAPSQKSYRYTFFEGKRKKRRTVLLNFPLYAQVLSFEVGVGRDCQVYPFAEWKNGEKIVFYGSSILQGGCVSRPGLCYTNIVSRQLRRECLNFGFSGNAFGEREVAQQLAKVKNAGVFVLDYEPNALEHGSLESTLCEFVRILRERHPQAYILIVSGTAQAADKWDAAYRACRKRAVAFERETAESLRRQGDDRIFFLDFCRLFGRDYTEFTVDGIHPTDAGAMLMAKRMSQKILNIWKAEHE